jgi:Protein of unknown function (DUF1566)
MNKLVASLVALVAVVVLGPASAPADTWGEPINVPGERFIVLGSYNDQAVLDKETGLVWEQSPSSAHHTWLDAQVSCNIKAVGNRRGWRLPTIQELASLIDPTVSSTDATLPPGHPFSNVQSSVSGARGGTSLYWSATTRASVPSTAWVVLFRFEGLVDAISKTAPYLAWCVRGGQGVNPQ